MLKETNSGAWASVPTLALHSVFLKVGFANVGNCLTVCRAWSHTAESDVFWRDLVKRQYGILCDEIPMGISSWRDYARFLRMQGVYFVNLGCKAPFELKFEYDIGEVHPARGLLDVQVVSVMECLGGFASGFFVWMCLTAGNELMLWTSEDMTSPANISNSFSIYNAEFKGKGAVSKVVNHISGGLVLTRDGKLFEKSDWLMVRYVGARFTRVKTPAGCKVTSMCICDGGVRVALLDNGDVYTWGRVYSVLYNHFGVNPYALFGQGDSPRGITTRKGMLEAPTPGKVDFQGEKIAEIAAGNAHFLAKSDNGDVWTWGVGGFDASNTPIRLGVSPTKLVDSGNVRKLHNGMLFEVEGGRLFAFLEPMSEESRSPLYHMKPPEMCTPLQMKWPWLENVSKIHSKQRDCGVREPIHTFESRRGDLGFGARHEGCYEVCLHGENACQTLVRPREVFPTFEVGGSVKYGHRGDIYGDEGGRIVVRQVKRPLAKDEYYALDLGRSLGVQPGRLSVLDRPFGDWVMVMMIRNDSTTARRSSANHNAKTKTA